MPQMVDKKNKKKRPQYTCIFFESVEGERGFVCPTLDIEENLPKGLSFTKEQALAKEKMDAVLATKSRFPEKPSAIHSINNWCKKYKLTFRVWDDKEAKPPNIDGTPARWITGIVPPMSKR